MCWWRCLAMLGGLAQRALARVGRDLGAAASTRERGCQADDARAVLTPARARIVAPPPDARGPDAGGRWQGRTPGAPYTLGGRCRGAWGHAIPTCGRDGERASTPRRAAHTACAAGAPHHPGCAAPRPHGVSLRNGLSGLRQPRRPRAARCTLPRRLVSLPPHTTATVRARVRSYSRAHRQEPGFHTTSGTPHRALQRADSADRAGNNNRATKHDHLRVRVSGQVHPRTRSRWPRDRNRFLLANTQALPSATRALFGRSEERLTCPCRGTWNTTPRAATHTGSRPSARVRNSTRNKSTTHP